MRREFLGVMSVFLLVCSCAPVAHPVVLIKSDPPATFDVAIARTPQERARGLMNVTSLPAGHGMLFVFDKDQQVSFWMKDTLIPLDILFINSMGVVVDIEHMSPCRADPCPTYSPSAPVRYALEIDGGAAQGMTSGMRADIQLSDR